MLELEPVRFKVIREVRPKLAAARAMDRSGAGAHAPRLNAAWPDPDPRARARRKIWRSHAAVSAGRDLAREGVELDRTLLAQWVGNVVPC